MNFNSHKLIKLSSKNKESELQLSEMIANFSTEYFLRVNGVFSFFIFL